MAARTRSKGRRGSAAAAGSDTGASCGEARGSDLAHLMAQLSRRFVVEDTRESSTTLSRRNLLATGGKVAAGIAAAGAVAQIPGVPTVLASSAHASNVTLNFM